MQDYICDYWYEPIQWYPEWPPVAKDTTLASLWVAIKARMARPRAQKLGGMDSAETLDAE